MPRGRRLLVIGIALAAIACNITKAVHVDDTAYLEMAQGILKDPLHPMSVPLNWGGYAAPAYIGMNQPALFFYVLAGTMWLVGDSDLALHGMMAIWTLLAVWLFHRLAMRIVPERAELTTALFALGPAFLPGQNVMTDVPLIVLWLACIDRWFALDLERPSSATYAWAAAAIAAACLIKYPSIVLIPIAVLVMLHRRHWRAMWTLAIPMGALLVWSGLNYLEFRGIHLLNRPAEVQVWGVETHLVEWIAGIGLAAPAALLLTGAGKSRRWSWVTVWAAALSGAFVAFHVAVEVPHQAQLTALWGIATFVGVEALLMVTGEAIRGWWTAADRRRRDESVVLLWWLLGAGGAMVVLAPFTATRHVLLAVPPLLLLLVRAASGRLRRAGYQAAAVTVTAALGLALAVGDWSLANTYRQLAPAIARTLPKDGSTIWFVGHWGWQWYAARAGMVPFDQKTSELKVGDSLVEPSVPPAQTIPPEIFHRLERVNTLGVPATLATRVRTFVSTPWGGYYAFFVRTGAFPLRLTDRPVEVFTIYRVAR